MKVRLTEKIDEKIYIARQDRVNGKIIGNQQCLNKLGSLEDAEEQGLLLRLDEKDNLITILATKLLDSEFGHCYMCKNNMKNITLDGVNNGCDGMCNSDEKATVKEFLEKIIAEINRKNIAIVNTAIFDNGFEMDIKCCGVQYNKDDESNTA